MARRSNELTKAEKIVAILESWDGSSGFPVPPGRPSGAAATGTSPNESVATETSSTPPIKTRRDIRGRRIKWGAALLAVALAIFGVMRFFGEKIWQLGLDRILPRLSQT